MAFKWKSSKLELVKAIETSQYSNGPLYKIVALRDIPAIGDFPAVKAGDEGGLVADESCLDQTDNSWLYPNCIAVNGIRIEGNSRILSHSLEKCESLIVTGCITRSFVSSSHGNLVGGWVYDSVLVDTSTRLDTHVRNSKLVDSYVGDEADIDNSRISHMPIGTLGGLLKLQYARINGEREHCGLVTLEAYSKYPAKLAVYRTRKMVTKLGWKSRIGLSYDKIQGCVDDEAVIERLREAVRDNDWSFYEDFIALAVERFSADYTQPSGVTVSETDVSEVAVSGTAQGIILPRRGIMRGSHPGDDETGDEKE